MKERALEHTETSNVSDVRQVMRALYPPVTITDGTKGTVVTGFADFSPLPPHQGAPGWVQGGLSATVLDYVSARIANTALGSPVATGTLDLRYRQPVLLDGGPYRVEGESDRPRSRTVRVHAAILSNDGRPLVEANGFFVAVTRDA